MLPKTVCFCACNRKFVNIKQQVNARVLFMRSSTGQLEIIKKDQSFCIKRNTRVKITLSEIKIMAGKAGLPLPPETDDHNAGTHTYPTR
jgi:hypothetical protein